MSRIVKGTGWRPLSHVVKTEDGKLYLVDSNDTFDCGYETMVFEWEDDEVSNWLGEYKENYSSETAMKTKNGLKKMKEKRRKNNDKGRSNADNCRLVSI